MVTTPKAPSPATAADKAAPKKTAAVKPVAAKKVAAKTVITKPVVVKTTLAPPVSAAPASIPPAKKVPAVKKVSPAKTVLKASTAPKPVLSTEQRNHYVAVAAFYIAERRGFTLGNPADDWMAAEAEVDRLISSGHFTS